MTAHERMEVLTALLQRARVIQETMYWRQVYRQANPLPRHEMTLVVWWLTLDKAPIVKAGKKAAA